MFHDFGIWSIYCSEVEELWNSPENPKWHPEGNTYNHTLLCLKEVKKHKLEDINLSVVKVKLFTGRHHQIRVQFAGINHSLYGDQKYGMRGRGKQICLWAHELSFKHPISKKELIFNSTPEITGSWEILNYPGSIV